MADTTRSRVLAPLARAAGRGVVWLTPRLLAATVYGLLIAGWATWVWLSGGRWTRTVRRQYVTRPVRAAGNWLATVTVAGLVAAPLVTVLVLTVAGVGLLVTASTLRRRALPAGGPIRVHAHIDRRLAHSR